MSVRLTVRHTPESRLNGSRYRNNMLLTLCGLTSQKTHPGGLELSALVREEAHPSFLYPA